mmetsp:Transcript_88926/g.250451  ORF Transcript_88926/g.250451 Transcript_88926/m.250451 type:complete len:171 (+) Transcript_88926:1045-1557(+)
MGAFPESSPMHAAGQSETADGAAAPTSSPMGKLREIPISMGASPSAVGLARRLLNAPGRKGSSSESFLKRRGRRLSCTISPDAFGETSLMDLAGLGVVLWLPESSKGVVSSLGLDRRNGSSSGRQALGCDLIRRKLGNISRAAELERTAHSGRDDVELQPGMRSHSTKAS